MDSDAFVALLQGADVHGQAAERILTALIARKTRLLYPATMLTETATLVQRRLKLPEIAAQIVQMGHTQRLLITPVTDETITAALAYFQPAKSSTHHTLFDAVVAATAKQYQAAAIFSFDGWYTALGFMLAEELVVKTPTSR